MSAEAQVAARLKWERERRHWSMAEVARRMADAGCPVNQTAIYKIEKGNPRRTISLNEAHALAEVFGLDTVGDLERIPEEIVHEDARIFVEETEKLRDDVRDLLRSLEGVGPRLAEIRRNVQPLMGYAGLTGLRFPTERLQAALTDMAENLVKIRDELAANPLELGRIGDDGGQE